MDVIHGRIPEGILKDKYVLVGTSAAGLLDLRSTPFDRVFPGVEINATIIDNVLAADAFHHNLVLELYTTLTIVIIGGVVLSAVLSWLGPRTAAISSS